jgi:hypothetical protein
MKVKMNMKLERIQSLPEDIINHIAYFCITKQMKFLCRIDKLNKKVQEMEKRTSDEWIQHIISSKIYRCKISEIKHTKVLYINMWGDKIYVPKSELINQGIIKHVRSLHLLYRQRIITQSISKPKYESETYTNIVGDKMIARFVESDYDDLRSLRSLVFIKV